MAVDLPGASVVRTADSWEAPGARPVSVMSCLFAAVVQLSLLKSNAPFMSRNSSVGSISAFATPKGISDGPIARTRTRFEALP